MYLASMSSLLFCSFLFFNLKTNYFLSFFQFFFFFPFLASFSGIINSSPFSLCFLKDLKESLLNLCLGSAPSLTPISKPQRESSQKLSHLLVCLWTRKILTQSLHGSLRVARVLIQQLRAPRESVSRETSKNGLAFSDLACDSQHIVISRESQWLPGLQGKGMDSTSWWKDCQRICGHFKTTTGTYGRWQGGIMNELTEVFSLLSQFLFSSIVQHACKVFYDYNVFLQREKYFIFKRVLLTVLEKPKGFPLRHPQHVTALWFFTQL